MKRGESVQLGINISAAELADIVGASSRDSVVNVEEGKVTAVKPGTAMITVLHGVLITRKWRLSMQAVKSLLLHPVLLKLLHRLVENRHLVL